MRCEVYTELLVVSNQPVYTPSIHTHNHNHNYSHNQNSHEFLNYPFYTQLTSILCCTLDSFPTAPICPSHLQICKSTTLLRTPTDSIPSTPIYIRPSINDAAFGPSVTIKLVDRGNHFQLFAIIRIYSYYSNLYNWLTYFTHTTLHSPNHSHSPKKNPSSMSQAHNHITYSHSNADRLPTMYT